MSLKAKYVAETNLILLKVRETLKKEKELNEARKMVNELKKQINEFYLVMGNGFLEHLDVQERIAELKLWKQKVKIIQQNIKESDEFYKKYAERVDSVLQKSFGGLIKKDEFDEQFISEYVYLIQHTGIRLFDNRFWGVKRRKDIKSEIMKDFGLK